MPDTSDPRIRIPQDAVWAEVTREREKLRAELERLRLREHQVAALDPLVNEAFQQYQAEIARLEGDVSHYRYRAQNAEVELERLRAELAHWKPSQCGKIYPVPVAGEVVKHCAREYEHDGPHQADTGEVWVLRQT